MSTNQIPLTEETIVPVLENIVGKSMKAAEEKLEAKFKAENEEKAKALELAKKSFEDEKEAEKAKSKVAINGKSVRDGVDYSRSIKFINCLIKKDFAGMSELGLKVLNSDVDSQGGFVVPEEFGTMVDEIRLNVGLARKLARYVPMKAPRKNMPILDNDVLVYWPGQGGVKTSSEFSFGNVVLEAEVLAGITVLTNELLDDSDIDMLRFIAQRFGQALAKEEDRQMLVGTGAPFMGIMTISGTNLVTMSSGNTLSSQVTIADLNLMRSSLEETLVNNAKWVMHRNVLAQIQSIKENGQSIVSFCNPVITSDYKGGLITPAAMLLGHEVYTSSQMPSTATAGQKFMIFGDFQYYYFGELKGQTMATSTDASVNGVSLFQTNSVGVRVEERVAMAPGLPAAFSILVTAAS